MKKAINTTVLFALALLASVGTEPFQVQAKENIELHGGGNRNIYGSNYWKTSNLREWANSDKASVPYTNASPDASRAVAHYEDEKGFLSNFTQTERDSIAVTEHRVYLSIEDGARVSNGGLYQIESNLYTGESLRFNFPSIDSYQNRYYQTVNDKVFLLTPYQVQRFVEKRNFPLIKDLTPEARLKNNQTLTNIGWWINGPTSNIGNDMNQVIFNDKKNVLIGTHPRLGYGFAPSIHLKGDTLVNGKLARDYKIGETLSFGNYLNSPILWKVINRASDGSPLLLSEKVLDVKSFDGKDDAFSWSESRYVDFPQADIPMNDSDTEVPFHGYDDITEPKVQVTNESALFERSNSSFTLQITATDADSGIDYIVLPTGDIITTPSFSFLVTENNTYVFKVKDKAGNLKVFTVPVSNINPESSVVIESSTEGWTNKNVNVDISASNDVGFQNKSWLMTSRDSTPYLFPNFTSYQGKRVRITGTRELISANAPFGNLTTGLGFYYRSSVKSGDDYYLSNRWQQPVKTTLAELNQTGKTSFDVTYTIPNDYFQNLQAWSQISINSNIKDFAVQYSNVSFELIDNDDFGIQKIILPSGQEIKQNTYRDTLTSDGIYEYKVLDSRGKTTEKRIEVKIDKDVPTLTVSSPSQEWTKEPYVLKVNAQDSLSGVREVILPNGQSYKGTSFDYLVNANGTYIFTAVDNAGNRKEIRQTVSNFDTTPPVLTFKTTPDEWTNKELTITITGSDSESGMDAIKTPNGAWFSTNESSFTVNQNGVYSFIGRDKLGNEKTYDITISNIDKTLPSISIQVDYQLMEGKANVNIQVRDL